MLGARVETEHTVGAQEQAETAKGTGFLSAVLKMSQTSLQSWLHISVTILKPAVRGEFYGM